LHVDIDSQQSEAASVRIREELARRRVSRQWLADEARISISTLEKALSGKRPFTLATVIRLEEALGLSLRNGSAEAKVVEAAHHEAPEAMGAYTRAAVRWLEGEYLTLRRSFGDAEAVFAYRTIIEWDDEDCHLRFRETGRLDSSFSQAGFVSFPNISGHIYLVTIESGQYRMVVLCRPLGGGDLNGLLTTLVVGSGSQLMPAASPIVLRPIGQVDDPALGLIPPGDPHHADYKARLDRIGSGGFAKLLA
jgi:transcriptional regulator with XRE-family HTH domain